MGTRGRPLRGGPDEPDDEDVRWLDRDQQRAWRALVLGSTLLFDRLDDEMAQTHGVSWIEYEILVRLSERQGRMRMAQLAASLAHSRSRTTHTITRMEGRGLVQREDAVGDRRGVDAVLTSEGWTLLQRTAPTHVDGVRRHLVDLVDPDDLAALGRVMDAVSDHLIEDHPEMEIRG